MKVFKQCLFYFFAGGTLFPVSSFPGSAREKAILISSEKKDRRVVFLDFRGEGLRDREKKLLRSLPEQLRRQAEEKRFYRLSRAERINEGRRVREQTAARAEKKLSAAREKRDRLLFDPDKYPGSSFFEKKELDREIRKERQERDRFMKMPLNQTRVPDRLPQKYELYGFSGSSDSSGSFGSSGSSRPENASPQTVREPFSEIDALLPPEALSRLTGADLLVSGRLLRKGSRLFLDVSAYRVWDASETTLWEGVLEADSLSAVIQEISLRLNPLLLGYAAGTLEVRSSDPNSFIYLDDDLKGIGSYSDDTLHPGMYRVRVKTPGSPPAEQKAEVLPGKKRTVSFSIQPAPEVLRLVRSVPSGANVYLDSLRVGQTPFLLPVPPEKSLLLAELPGYWSRKLVIGPDQKEPLLLSLDFEEKTPREERKESRKKFLGALSAFSLSLAAPILSRVLAGDTKKRIAAVYQAGRAVRDQEMIKQLSARYLVFESLFSLSSIISGVLLINTISQLNFYLKTSENGF